ncbi:MAG: sugar phosphate nucleotidyltransferase [Anaerolineae bacterium]|jgi:glucose-1-phosphate thymidylyltransferase|nr:sugar phosphate nucleotidyltransferase [Anaerolineae bacterium]MDH7475080.1 sugar phosphate nucleotidyltransferase [Anaerolineae bacterium]
MKVVIPLAGFGTRLRPHTYTKPKPLLNVAGKPVLGHILDKFTGLSVEEVIFITGWLGDQIEAYVEANYNFPSTHYIEQKELLGQAHAISLAASHLEGPVLILFVDTLFEADLAPLFHEQADAVIYAKEVEDPRRFGVVVLEGDRIVRFIEKPDGFEHRLAVIGLYWVKDGRWLLRAIQELMARNIQTKGEFYLADAFQLMIDQGAYFKAEVVEVWEDCGKPETVLHTNRYLLDNGHDNSLSAVTEQSVLVPPVYIAPTARVVQSVIGPYATLADGCVVRNSIVRDSIIDCGAFIEDAMLERSLIGERAVVRGRYRVLNVGDSSHVDDSGS